MVFEWGWVGGHGAQVPFMECCSSAINVQNEYENYPEIGEMEKLNRRQIVVVNEKRQKDESGKWTQKLF